jgi:hypothetical protein
VKQGCAPGKGRNEDDSIAVHVRCGADCGWCRSRCNGGICPRRDVRECLGERERTLIYL